jgi:peroxiredoxin
VCSDQLSLHQTILPEFEASDAALAAISVDGAWCHRAFAEARGLTFGLLSDFEPKGEVSRRYDAYRSQDGFGERALFVLDPEGRIAWREVVAPEQNPGADGILRVLDDMTVHSARRPR